MSKNRLTLDLTYTEYSEVAKWCEYAGIKFYSRISNSISLLPKERDKFRYTEYVINNEKLPIWFDISSEKQFMLFKMKYHQCQD